MKKKLLVTFFCLSFLFLVDLNYSKAISVFKNESDAKELGLSQKSVISTIESVSRWILRSVAVLSMLMIIVGGVWYIVSAGDQDATEDATDMIIWAVTGLVICLLAYGIVVITSSILGAGTPQKQELPKVESI